MNTKRPIPQVKMPRQGVSETDPLWRPWAIHWTCRMGYLNTLEYQFEYLCISLSLDWKFHQLARWSSCQALNSKAHLGQSSRSSHPYTPLCFRSVFFLRLDVPKVGQITVPPTLEEKFTSDHAFIICTYIFFPLPNLPPEFQTRFCPFPEKPD